MEASFLSFCRYVACQRRTPAGCSLFHNCVQFSLEILKSINTGSFVIIMLWPLRQESRLIFGNSQSTHNLHIISKSDNENPVIHPHLSSFSCGTLKAAGHDEWGLSVIAVVAPGCHHWGNLSFPALTTAQGHSWAYMRPLNDRGNSEALSASTPLPTQNLVRCPNHLDRLHGA